MKGSGRFHRCALGELTLITNQHIAVIHQPGSFEMPEGEEYPPLAKLWPDHTGNMKSMIVPGGLFHCGPNYARKMGDGAEFIDEAFFRCFDSPKTTWRLGVEQKSANGWHSIIALVDEKPVAIIMPIRASKEDAAIMVDVSDEEAFAPFRSEENGHYLASRAKIAAKIAEIRESISDNADRISELKKENDEYQRELESLERTATSIVERTPANAKTD
jgi:hypothetical protein